MASVIREGGQDPIVVDSWQTATKSVLLDYLYDNNGGEVSRLWSRHLGHRAVIKQFNHYIIRSEIELILQEMYRDGWIKPSGFICECCKDKTFSPEQILKHATCFVLTEKGYDKIREHIFP